jgi:hypothetical protein
MFQLKLMANCVFCQGDSGKSQVSGYKLQVAGTDGVITGKLAIGIYRMV